MKITGIEIGEYRQFKNIKFDFTYPEGHAKAGQPLDKVCFIGQSGTGKTTLLNIIWELASVLDKVADAHDHKADVVSYADNFLSEVFHAVSYWVNINGDLVNLNRLSGIEKSDRDFLNDWFSTKLTKSQQYKFIDTNKICLFIKDGIARDSDAFLIEQRSNFTSFEDFIKTDSQVEQDELTRENLMKDIGRKRSLSLGDSRSLSIWQYLLREIYQYDESGIELIQALTKSSSVSVHQILERLDSWKKHTPNPRLDLAEKCLNPILHRFYLEMDVDSDKVPIVIKTNKGVRIDSRYLSTGTRQLLATAIPVYKFDTVNTVILFDEPERSLFPDIQRILIDYYVSLAPQAQFFFATHSPIIASAFEPCERFILYFNENGEVKYRTGIAPEGDDPNDILSEDFGLQELMLSKGLEEYERYRQLAMRIREETDEEKKNKLIIERLELGNRYNFAGRYAKS